MAKRNSARIICSVLRTVQYCIIIMTGLPGACRRKATESGVLFESTARLEPGTLPSLFSAQDRSVPLCTVGGTREKSCEKVIVVIRTQIVPRVISNQQLHFNNYGQ